MINHRKYDFQYKTRVCKIDGHENRKVEFVCMHPGCALSRFACSQCLTIGNHKHKQYNDSHILKYEEFHEVIKDKINQRLNQLLKSDEEDSSILMNLLKQQIQLIQNSLQNIIKMIDNIGQDMQLINNRELLNQMLTKMRIDDFIDFDDKQLSLLLNYNQYISDSYMQIQNQLSHINQSVIKIQEKCHSEQIRPNQKIKDAKYKIITLEQNVEDNKALSLAISNDLRFIVSGSSNYKLKIWNRNNRIIKFIQFKNQINQVQFTDDSRLLYIATQKQIYQFYLFKQKFTQKLHNNVINNIYCISANIILTSCTNGTIIKTDTENKKQLLYIKAHNERTNALDYNHKLNIIASASYDKSIKLWNGINGQLILEKQNAYNKECKFIYKVLFMINQNQLLSLDSFGNVIIWNINFENQQLELLKEISDDNLIYNISLVLNQQYITLICGKYIKIYTIKGEYIREFNHDVKRFYLNNVIQHESMKAILIKGKKKLQVCKVNLD